MERLLLQSGKDVKVKSCGKEKQGYTLGVTCTLSGKLLKSLLIWSSTGRKRFQTLTPSNLWIECRAAGSWIDSNILSMFKILLNHISLINQKTSKAFGHECHKKPEIKQLLQSYNVEVIFFPPNCTSLEPFDIGVNRSIKAKYREIWEQFNSDPESNTFNCNL